MKSQQYFFLLFILFSSIYIMPLGFRMLTVPDEIRYAEIPREMIADNDWIVPHFNGLKYFEKPVLGYWIHACSIMVFGENNFAVRLPAALAALLSAILIFLLVHMVSRDRNKEYWGLFAVFIFLTCFEVFGVANAPVLDNLFSLFLTLCITAFYCASRAVKKSKKEISLLILSGVGCGLAFLTKGFLAFAIPVMVLTPYLVWQRRYFDLIRMSWLPITAAVILILPWSISIHLKEPDFWRFFFWHEHIRRFVSSNAQHKAPFWYFFIASPGIFMPWIPLIPSAVIGLKERLQNLDNRQDGELSLIKLSISWLIAPFLFFSLSHGKLLTYVLPCFPPFAILMTSGLLYTARSEKQNCFLQRGIIVNSSLFLLLLIIFVIVQNTGFKGIYPYTQSWKSVMAVNSLIFLLLFNYWAVRHQDKTKKILFYGFSTFLLMLSVNFIVPDLALEKKSPGLILEKYSRNDVKGKIVISDNNSAGAVCWYFKRNDVYILGTPGEYHYGLEHNGSNIRKLDIQTVIRLMAENPGNLILVGRTRKMERWRQKLPKPVYEETSGDKGYVLLEY